VSQARHPDLQRSNRLAFAGKEERLGDLPALFETWALAAGAGPGDRLAVISEDPRALVVAAVGLHAQHADGAVISTAAATPPVRTTLAQRGYSLLELGPDGAWARLDRIDPRGGPTPGRVALLTSGTTGVPKLLVHSWESLRTLPAEAAKPERRWLLTYLPGTYAWFQMLTLWMFSAGQTLVASAGSSPEEIWDDGLAARFDAVSSTPTFWRYLLALRSSSELAWAPLRQITLGGEPVRQDLLDRLHALFPAARLTHIYASTEVGAAIVVNDGREGFPAAWLDGAGPGRCRLRSVDGILHVRSPFAAEEAGGEGGWHATGDRLEIFGDRALVAGRAEGDLLNVGGRKASAAAIERLLQTSPLVSWCHVRGTRAPLVGTLLAADLVVSEQARGLSQEDLERELTAFCTAGGLSEWMVPRLWTLFDRIPVSAAFKAEARRG
jgi:acyl-CoA synthetase (AMP-forming)/AMP-acid ligase II